MKKKRKKDKFSQLDSAVGEILSDIKSKDPESKDDERQKIDQERLSDGDENSSHPRGSIDKPSVKDKASSMKRQAFKDGRNLAQTQLIGTFTSAEDLASENHLASGQPPLLRDRSTTMRALPQTTKNSFTNAKNDLLFTGGDQPLIEEEEKSDLVREVPRLDLEAVQDQYNTA